VVSEEQRSRQAVDAAADYENGGSLHGNGFLLRG